MNGKHSPTTQRKSWQSFTTVILAVILLLSSVTPVLSSSGSGDPSPTPPVGPPSQDRLRELAAQYRDINFNSDYTGDMPSTEQEAVAQLELLASIRDAIEDMPDEVPPAPLSEAQTASGYQTLGTRWQSCDAPLNPVVSLLSWFRVRHTVKSTYEDHHPHNITNVTDHTTAPISGGITIGGILVQVTYVEMSKWHTGPEYKYIESLRVLKAIWKLWSNYHVFFSAGPFNYSAYDVTRGCQIA